MSQVPTDTPTARGFEPPKAIQFSVFLDNRVGRLLDLLEVFQNQKTTIAGLSVVDSADHAVVRLVTSNSALTRRLLNRFEHACSEIDLVVVELPDESASLLSVCEVLLSAELNIHYAYPLIVRPRGLAAIALQTDDTVLAGSILRRRGFYLLAENDLGENAPGGDPGEPF